MRIQTATNIFATAAVMMPALALAGVTSFADDFDSYGDGDFAFVEPVTEGEFFDNNWQVSGIALWTYTLQGDGQVSFQSSNPPQGSMATTVSFEPGAYEIVATLNNATSAIRSMSISLGGTNATATVGGDGVTTRTFTFVAAVVGDTNNRLRFGSIFRFAFTPTLLAIAVNPIPAPGTALVAAAGGLAVARRRRR